MAVSAGAEIEAWCPACKDLRTNVVVAMKGTRAAKTECRVCGSVHAYRKNPPDHRAKKKNQYADAMEGRDISKPLPYKITKKYNQDDVIKHKTFGLGLVTKVVSDKKLEVLFEDSSKLMIQGR